MQNTGKKARESSWSELEVKSYRRRDVTHCMIVERTLFVKLVSTRWSNFSVRNSSGDTNVISNLFFMAVHGTKRGGITEERKKCALKGTERNVVGCFVRWLSISFVINVSADGLCDVWHLTLLDGILLYRRNMYSMSQRETSGNECWYYSNVSRIIWTGLFHTSIYIYIHTFNLFSLLLSKW